MVCTGRPHDTGRHAKAWNAQPASYYPDDEKLLNGLDMGIKQLHELLGKELRDAPHHPAYVMWERLGIDALPASPNGLAVSYVELAKLPLLSTMQVMLTFFSALYS